MRLTDILREQHAQLLLMLEELHQQGMAGDDGCERLRRARDAMLAHLSLEDHRLYPALQTDPGSCVVARRYADEMRQLTPALVAFFDTYRDGDADPLAFERSLEQLMAVLRQRIEREEVRLYPAYERHLQQTD